MTIYPNEVSTITNVIVDKLVEVGLLEDHPQITTEILYEEFGKEFFNKWVDGDDLILDEDLAQMALKRAIAVGMLNELIQEGLVDTIETDDEDFIFLTEKGKQVAEEFNETNEHKDNELT